MLAMLFLAPAVFAQDEDAADQAEEPQLETIEDYMDAWEQVRVEFMEEVRAARGDRDKMMELRESQPDPSEYAGPIWELAKADPTAESAREGLFFALSMLRSPEDREEIIEVILEHHGECEELADILPVIPRMYPDSAEEMLMKIKSSNPNASVQAAAIYTLYTHLDETRKDAEDVEAVDATLEELKTALMGDYSEEADSRGVAYSARMEAIEFQKMLEVGMPVPDIEGEDIEGVAFKLSDYKGKVILLDFWGHW